MLLYKGMTTEFNLSDDTAGRWSVFSGSFWLLLFAQASYCSVFFAEDLFSHGSSATNVQVLSLAIKYPLQQTVIEYGWALDDIAGDEGRSCETQNTDYAIL